MIGNVQDIDLKLLRVFRVVAQHGGFVAAQTELNVSLPTISNQIKQLEERLGVRLCERGNLGFRLTPPGAALIRASNHLFAAVDEFRTELAELARKPAGEVRLGIVDNLTTDPSCRIPEALASIHRKWPGVAVQFFIGPPSELESQVLNGALDLAIGLFPTLPPALDATRLFAEEHGLYCARGHPLYDKSDAEIRALDLLQSAYVSWSYQESYVSARVASRFNVQSGTPFMEALVYLVLSGLYIGYLPRHSAQQWVGTGRLRQLLPDDMSRTIDVFLISRRSQRTKPIVASVRDELVVAHTAAARQGA